MTSHPKKFGLKKKLIVVFLFLGLFPLCLSLITSYYSQKAILTKTMGNAFQELARQTSIKIRLLMGEFVNEAQLLSGHHLIRIAVRRSIESYPENAKGEWIGKNPSERSREIDQEASSYLRQVKEGHNDLYSELILVDKFGGLVAAFPPPDRVQFRDLVWWQAAYQSGMGAIYIGEIQWDPLTNQYGFPVAVPVKDGEDLIGILLARHKVDRINQSVTTVHLGATDHTMLVNSKGDLLFCPVFGIKNHVVDHELIGLISTGGSSWIKSRVDIHFPDHEAISGFSQVDLNLDKMSDSSFEGNQWYVITSQDPSETYQPLKTLLGWTALSAVFTIIVLIILTVMTSHWIAAPIIRLQGVAEEIISGILQLSTSGSVGLRDDEEIKDQERETKRKLQEIKTGDEIEDLAAGFLKMDQALLNTRRELIDSNRRLQEMATTDELTGLYNRHFIGEALKTEFVRTTRFGLILSLLMIDLDFFKKINDQYGHQTGDKVLKGLAQLLLTNSRGPDVIGRFGGEEFIIILPHTDAKGAFIQAERIREQVERHRFPMGSDQFLKITISIGIATYPNDRIDRIEQLVDMADQALYASKRLGRNRSSAEQAL